MSMGGVFLLFVGLWLIGQVIDVAESWRARSRRRRGAWKS
jgi:hypothetical protein